MLQQVKEYGKIKDQYGDQAFCYLCGLETHKSCECVYYSTRYEIDQYKLTDEYIQQLAEENAQPCVRSKIIGTQGKSYEDNLNLTGIVVSG